MKRAIVALIMTLGVTVGALTGVPSSSARQQTTEDDALLEASFVPCSPAICGRFPANTAALGLKKGMVVVAETGVVRIMIHGLTVLSTGAIAANQVLEVHVGSFTPGAFEDAVPILGTITTDENGNFSGTVDTGQGPFAFTAGSTISGEFVLNERFVRSDFITGFTVSGDS
jgi:hypothetical protein